MRAVPKRELAAGTLLHPAVLRPLLTVNQFAVIPAVGCTTAHLARRTCAGKAPAMLPRQHAAFMWHATTPCYEAHRLLSPTCCEVVNMQTGVAPWTDLVLAPFSLITADADLVNSKGATVHTHPQLHAISRMPGKQLHLPSTAAYSVQPGAGLARVAFHSHLRQLRTFANTRSSHDQFGPSSRLPASG